jgi:hypothetical protein
MIDSNMKFYQESIAAYKGGIQHNLRHPQVPKIKIYIASIAHNNE